MEPLYALATLDTMAPPHVQFVQLGHTTVQVEPLPFYATLQFQTQPRQEG